MSYWTQYPDLTFDEEHHKYFWRRVVCQGVTGVMDRIGVRENDQKPFIPIGCPDFAKRVHDSNFGSACHAVYEIILKGGIPKYPIEMEPWVKAFLLFLSENKFKPLYDQNGNPLIEYPMYSVSYRYAGTPDLIAINDKDEIILFDWKTATSYQKSYSYQTAAYEQLTRETFGGKLFPINKKIKRITVLFNADGYKLVPATDTSDWTMFLSMRNILAKAA